MLEQHLPNIRATLAWVHAKGDVQLSLRLATAFGRFWERSGHLREGHDWLEAALDRSIGEPTAWRARALTWAGILARRRGKLAQAEAWLQQSVAANRALADTWGTAHALVNSGLVLEEKNDRAAARAQVQESLELFKTCGDTGGMAGAINDLGEIARLQGDHAAARKFYEDALVLARAQEDGMNIALTLMNLGHVCVAEHEYTQAARLVGESLHLLRGLGNPQVALSENLEILAAVATRQSEPERAARLYAAAEALRQATDIPLPVADRLAVEQDVAALRATMDEASFTAAWSAGRELASEQAVAYALHEHVPT